MTRNADSVPDEFGHARAMREKLMEGKKGMRRRLAALSFSEKTKILEKLRDRDKTIAASGLKRKPGGKQQ